MLRQKDFSSNGTASNDKEGGRAETVDDSSSNQPNGAQENGAEDGNASTSGESSSEREAEKWEPKPPKVLMDDPEAVPLELRSQIQLYATNE